MARALLLELAPAWARVLVGRRMSSFTWGGLAPTSSSAMPTGPVPENTLRSLRLVLTTSTVSFLKLRCGNVSTWPARVRDTGSSVS